MQTSNETKHIKHKKRDHNNNAWVRRSEEVGKSELQLLLLAPATLFIFFFFNSSPNYVYSFITIH